EWQEAAEGFAEALNLASLSLDWADYPEWRPGCGSRSADPLIADRLRAESENSPLRARRIEVGAGDDEAELMFDLGFSDGLPLVPPTPERVLRMLRGTGRDAQEILATVPPNMGEATVEKLAINA
ncbi:MAG: TlpA family protein disulfide reductase, partial [Gammaproteobacteria bacterium]|nr:TlpA family protein disulfide reductase [Gammaproteobacteria bacterium]